MLLPLESERGGGRVGGGTALEERLPPRGGGGGDKESEGGRRGAFRGGGRKEISRGRATSSRRCFATSVASARSWEERCHFRSRGSLHHTSRRNDKSFGEYTMLCHDMVKDRRGGA